MDPFYTHIQCKPMQRSLFPRPHQDKWPYPGNLAVLPLQLCSQQLSWLSSHFCFQPRACLHFHWHNGRFLEATVSHSWKIPGEKKNMNWETTKLWEFDLTWQTHLATAQQAQVSKDAQFWRPNCTFKNWCSSHGRHVLWLDASLLRVSNFQPSPF